MRDCFAAAANSGVVLKVIGFRDITQINGKDDDACHLDHPNH
jgi:hypothetical protein